ncbi:TLC domain-containing protein 4 isoform X2 [Manis javanica]|uniref:TLC domain-containing protein 4 isoform X2 n=1 Tax=Manis javanica TaxID=9974 RepID=UPI00187A3592|nr:TLC domain-containing protein 4-like isoform X2 [Manis javanica]
MHFSHAELGHLRQNVNSQLQRFLVTWRAQVEEIWIPTPKWSSALFLPAFSPFSFFSTLVVSTCHSLVVGVLGLYIFFFDEASKADPLWGDPSLVKVNIAISSGYIISDLLLLILYWKVIGDKYFIIHHCTALYAYFFLLKDGVLGYIGNFRLLSELSSPFVNQRFWTVPHSPVGVSTLFSSCSAPRGVSPVLSSQRAWERARGPGNKALPWSLVAGPGTGGCCRW